MSFISGSAQRHSIHLWKSTLTRRLKNYNQIWLYTDIANLYVLLFLSKFWKVFISESFVWIVEDQLTFSFCPSSFLLLYLPLQWIISYNSSLKNEGEIVSPCDLLLANWEDHYQPLTPHFISTWGRSNWFWLLLEADGKLYNSLITLKIFWTENANVMHNSCQWTSRFSDL